MRSKCLVLFGVLASVLLILFWISSLSNQTLNRPKSEVSVVTQESSNKSTSKNPAIAALVDYNLKTQDRIGSDISARIPIVHNKDDYPVLVDCLLNTNDVDAVRNEVINLLSRSHFSELAPLLIRIIENPDESNRFRTFATQHLGAQLSNQDIETRTRVRDKLLQLLEGREIGPRREALLALVRHKDPVASATARRWLNETSEEYEAVKDLAIRSIQELDMRDEMPIIRSHLKSANEATRIASIVVLSQWGDEESRAAFEVAASSTNSRLQRAGKAAIQRLNSIKNSP